MDGHNLFQSNDVTGHKVDSAWLQVKTFTGKLCSCRKLPKTKEASIFRKKKGLEFDFQEVEVCNILSHVVTQLLDRRSRARSCNFTRASIGSDNGSLGGYLLNLTSKEIMRWKLCLNAKKHALVQSWTNFTAPVDDN